MSLSHKTLTGVDWSLLLSLSSECDFVSFALTAVSFCDVSLSFKTFSEFDCDLAHVSLVCEDVSFAQMVSLSLMGLSESECDFSHLSLGFEFMSAVGMALYILVVLSAILSDFECVLALLFLE